MPQSGFEDGFAVTTGGSLDTWVKEIHAKVPGVIEGYVYDQLKLAISDFFQRTKAWRTFLGPFTIDANDGVLCLNPVDAHSKVIQVLSVNTNGNPLVQIDARTIPRILERNTSARTASQFFLEPYDTIKLFPVPVVDIEEVYVAVALTPRLRSDNRIPDWIVAQCYEVIKAAALQRLYEEPGKIYSNVEKAEYWGKKYRAEMVRSRTVAAAGYGESPQQWSFPRWNM